MWCDGIEGGRGWEESGAEGGGGEEGENEEEAWCWQNLKNLEGATTILRVQAEATAMKLHEIGLENQILGRSWMWHHVGATVATAPKFHHRRH